jgi:hypothetical protein
MKMGQMGCPAMSIRNSYSRLRNISEEHISHMMIWQYRTWFGSTWYGSERSGLAHAFLIFHMQIYDYLTYLSTKFKEKTASCIRINMVTILGQSLKSLQCGPWHFLHKAAVHFLSVECLKNCVTINKRWQYKFILS